MAEKLIQHRVPDEQRVLSIETLKVGEEALEYLRNNGFVTIEDVIQRKKEIPEEHKKKILVFLVFGIESE